MIEFNASNLGNFAPSCQRNQQPILEQLELLLADKKQVLELGSFSGQHALYFSHYLPHLTWQTSDQAENIATLADNLLKVAKLSKAGKGNCLAPIALDVSQPAQWPANHYDAIFTANTLHIMSWHHVQALFDNIGAVCKKDSVLAVYGPFKYQGQFTSASNADFELWLKARDSFSGIRDFEAVNQLAEQAGFKLMQDVSMPANNQLITWQYQ